MLILLASQYINDNIIDSRTTCCQITYTHNYVIILLTWTTPIHAFNVRMIIPLSSKIDGSFVSRINLSQITNKRICEVDILQSKSCISPIDSTNQTKKTHDWTKTGVKNKILTVFAFYLSNSLTNCSQVKSG